MKKKSHHIFYLNLFLAIYRKFSLLLLFFHLAPIFVFAQWTVKNVGTASDIDGVYCYATNDIFLGAVDGLIKSNDSGNTWTTLPLIDQFGNSILLSTLYDTYFFDPNTGTVYWNCCDRVSPHLPWSGRKHSGLGATLSHLGIRTFTKPKGWHLRG